jgi:hypothetical protein
MEWNNIKVGDTFRYRGKDGAVYDFEVTRKNENDYTVQARTMTKNGKSIGLFGPAHITTLVKDDAEFGGVRMSQTFEWYKKEDNND